MAKVLLAWEFGGGLGHVGPLRALGAEFVRRGHTVAIATTPGNLQLCHQAFANSGIEVLPAPALPLSGQRLMHACSYSDVLYDCGFASSENLTTTVNQWLQFYDHLQPSLLIADFSPTALLASCVCEFPKVATGISFACPPDITPLPSLRSEIPEPAWAAEIEQTVLDQMNLALKSPGGSPLHRVTDVFSRADRVYPMTLAEVDVYEPWRKSSNYACRYWPPIGTLPGVVLDWPAAGDSSSNLPKVFVYLRDCPAEYPLLAGLAMKQMPTICYSPQMPDEQRATFANSSVLVSSTPVDLNPLLGECDLAVLNGGHGTVSSFLQAGTPMLLFPLTLEQQSTAERLSHQQVAKLIDSDDLNELGAALESLLEDPAYRENARTIAASHRDFDEATALQELVADMIQVIEEYDLA